MPAAVHKTKQATLGKKEIVLSISQEPQRAAAVAAVALSPALHPSHPHWLWPNQSNKVSAKNFDKETNSDKTSEERRSWQIETDRERKSESVCGCAGSARQNQKPVRPGLFQFIFAFKSYTSDFVIDVSRALRRHLLNYVDRMAVVAADLLVVWAEDAVSSPERDDDVARLWAVIVPAASAPFGRGQGA